MTQICKKQIFKLFKQNIFRPRKIGPRHTNPHRPVNFSPKFFPKMCENGIYKYLKFGKNLIFEVGGRPARPARPPCKIGPRPGAIFWNKKHFFTKISTNFRNFDSNKYLLGPGRRSSGGALPPPRTGCSRQLFFQKFKKKKNEILILKSWLDHKVTVNHRGGILIFCQISNFCKNRKFEILNPSSNPNFGSLTLNRILDFGKFWVSTKFSFGKFG